MPRSASSISTRRQAVFSSFLGVVAVAILYSRFPCHRYFVDGLSAARDLETSVGWLAHPHHPLFPLAPQILFWFIGGESAGASGLGLLILWAVVFGVLACWVLALVLRTAGLSISSTLAGVGIFAFSAGVWYFSVTPNQYSTALALNVFATLSLVAAVRRPPGELSWGNVVAIGLLIGLAALAHQVNALLVIPAVYVVARNRPRPGRAVWRVVAAVAVSAAVALGFTVFAGAALLGFRSVADFVSWQHSYVTYPWYWAQGPLDSLQRTFHGAIELHLAHVFHTEGLFGDWRAELGSSIWYLRLILRIGQAYVLGFLAVETVRTLVGWIRSTHRLPVQTLGVWCALPFVVFTFLFTPESANYRIFYLPGFLLLVMPALEVRYSLRCPELRRSWPVVALVVFLFGCNFAAKFLPESRQENNPFVAEAGLVASMVGPSDLIVFSGAGEDYLRAQYAGYFARCDTMLMHDLAMAIRERPEEVLDGFSRRIKAGGMVLVHEDVLSSAEDLEWVNKFYGTDIQSGELADFFSARTREATRFRINEKDYIAVAPLPKESATDEESRQGKRSEAD